MKKKHLAWLRCDLRTVDNTALAKACEDPDAEVYAVFIATPDTWHAHDVAPVKERLIYRHLQSLAKDLAKLNIPLIYLEAHTFDQSIDALLTLIDEYDISRVFYNKEYGVNEKKRDAQFAQLLETRPCQLHDYDDQTMVAPGLRTKAGHPFKVFTPFKRAWQNHCEHYPVHCLAVPKKRKAVAPIVKDSIPEPKALPMDKFYPAGCKEAHKRLQHFCDNGLWHYANNRDIPAVPGTSVLSPYLAIGALSTRSCYIAAMAAKQDHNHEHIHTWVNELIWRDFYIHILHSFPKVSKGLPFKDDTLAIQWVNNDNDFKAWCEGRTGIPLVDAAMTQLINTGWMHNRLRMVCAMFLSKHLLVDWRRGEQFFMQHLVDGHLASNNGGWQWAASTGTDAVPYFRVFNPATQSQRFDAKGDFIRSQLPALAEIPAKQIHLPPKQLRDSLGVDYPCPIIDLKYGRLRAIETFKAVKSPNKSAPETQSLF